MTDPPRAPGVWVPYAALGVLFSMVVFVAAFIGTVRVIERDLKGLDDHLTRVDRFEEEAGSDRREFAVRLGRLEAALGVDRRAYP